MTELCTESSHINPLLGRCYLSLPCRSAFSFFVSVTLSVSLSALLLFILFFLLTSFFFFFYPSLSVCLWPLLSYLSNHSSSQTSHCLALLSLQVIDTCVTGCHFVLRAPHWHQQVANVTLAWRRVGTSERRWRWNCRGGLSCVCLCHRRVRRDWSAGKVRETESVGIRMEQRAFSRTAGIDNQAACTHNPHEHSRSPRSKVCVNLCMGEHRPPPFPICV